MGFWGTGISSNDTYADVYDDFMEMYNDGVSVKEITDTLLKTHSDSLNSEEDYTSVWFAIAKAQWECKENSTEVRDKVKSIIENRDDLKIWQNLGADQKDIKARTKVLEQFWAKLQIPKEKAKKRVKKKYYTSIFKKGDCLVYEMDNGNYGGAFVLTDEENTEGGINYIAITTIDKNTKASLSDFESAEIYVRRVNDTSFKNGRIVNQWVDKPYIVGCVAISFKNAKIKFDVIGNLSIINEYKPMRETYTHWDNIKEPLPFKNEYIKINGEAKLSMKLSEWTKGKGWLGKIFK